MRGGAVPTLSTLGGRNQLAWSERCAQLYFWPIVGLQQRLRSVCSVLCAVFKTGLEDKKVEEVGGARRSSESMRAMFSLSLTKKYFAIQISTPILHKYLIDAKNRVHSRK